MKKSSLVLLSMVLTGAACAKESPSYSRDLYSPDTHPMTILAVGLADPVQLPQANYNVAGLRWSIFYGSNFTVSGIDVGLVGRVNDSFTGLALTAADWVEGDVVGAQLSGVASIIKGNATGFQMAPFVNYNHGVFTGFQTGLVNYDGTFNGLQFGGLNWDKGLCYGLQVGVGNVAVSEFHGWSVGLINYTERLTGLQVGLVNVAGDSGSGLQLGVFNGASKFSGLQVGLLNMIGNAAVPVLPIVNGNF